MPDRIECGTFLIAGAVAGNPITVIGGIVEQQTALITVLRRIGAKVSVGSTGITVQRPAQASAVSLKTAPYPGIATDLQPQLMALLTCSDGLSTIIETVFEARFRHVDQLKRMGAMITINDTHATILGVQRLRGTLITGTDLRACAGLIIAALLASGDSLLYGIKHLDRGYENLEQKLYDVGARISRSASNQEAVTFDRSCL